MAKFIVVDGLDGCGKATQVGMLGKRLIEEGKKACVITFPNYKSESSAAVKMYLNGELGTDASLLNPYMCSTFYAVDRFIQYNKTLKTAFEDDELFIISDRYLSANIIHQGAKIKDNTKKHEFIKWCYEFECDKGGLPKEDITILLTIPPEISQGLLLNRYGGDSSKKDIHENNIEYLRECYDEVKDSVDYIKTLEGIHWEWLDCSSEDGVGVKSIIDIHEQVYEIIKNKFNL